MVPNSRGGGGGLKQGRFVIYVFSGFAVFGGPEVPRCWEKQHEKCHCHTPFCVPHMLAKLGLESNVPKCCQAKHGKNDKSTPSCPFSGGGGVAQSKTKGLQMRTRLFLSLLVPSCPFVPLRCPTDLVGCIFRTLLPGDLQRNSRKGQGHNREVSRKTQNTPPLMRKKSKVIAFPC